jgi:hypothetical protein
MSRATVLPMRDAGTLGVTYRRSNNFTMLNASGRLGL